MNIQESDRFKVGGPRATYVLVICSLLHAISYADWQVMSVVLQPMMQELGSEMLREQGYRVMVARDGVEAVEIYQAHTNEIALVILDLLMPRLDGGQTYLQMKKINKNVKAFFCTGYSPEEVIGPLLAKESLTALQKPFRPEEFINTVRELLSAN